MVTQLPSQRETLLLEDGGSISLDWIGKKAAGCSDKPKKRSSDKAEAANGDRRETSDSFGSHVQLPSGPGSSHDYAPSTPIVLLLHHFAGHSKDDACQSMAKEVLAKGWRCVSMNYRCLAVCVPGGGGGGTKGTMDLRGKGGDGRGH